MLMTEKNISLELAEKSVLGTMLADNDLIGDSQLSQQHFTVKQHQIIFAAMQELNLANKSADYITLLSVREAIELGGANYLLELQNYASPQKFTDHVDILFKHWQQTKKYQILIQAQQENWSIEEIQKHLDEISSSDAVLDTSITQALVEATERPYSPASVKKGIHTDLRDLDRMTNGFQDGELFILAARPSIGKTDTMNHFSIQAGLKGYLPIIFSLEMDRDTLLDRMIASVANIDRSYLRDLHGLLSDEQKVRWVRATGILNTARIQIDDRPGLTVPQIRAMVRNLMKQHPLLKPLILIDYLQIIRPNNEKANQTQQVGQISRDLKHMARELKCPVVCLSQLNRAVEQRQDKRPVMSDIRDSGNIEQDADVIAFLYRDDYYDKESDSKNLLEVIIAKHRNGPTGTVTLAYMKETGRLINVDWGNAR